MDPVPVLGVIVIVSVLAGLLHRTVSARMAQGIQAGGTHVSAGATPGSGQAPSAVVARIMSKEELLASGVEGHAKVLRATPTGERDAGGGEVYDLLFEVRLEGMAAFQAPSRAAVPPERAPRMVAGATLAVKADPSNPQVMAVDWEHTE